MSYLEENKAIKDISKAEDLDTLSTGDFVRMKGTISVNPLVNVFDSLYHMMNMIMSITP